MLSSLDVCKMAERKEMFSPNFFQEVTTFQTLSIHYTQQNNIITLPIANTCGGIVPSDFPLYFFTV
jgi:hypothetical protein